jgi:hypothetical protein
MRFQHYLLEKKDHIIKRLKNLSKEEKDILMPLFSSNNPKLEAMIDWNNKKLTFSDFKSVLDYRSKRSISKGVKKQGIKGLKKNKDYIELKNVSKNYNAYIPLTYEASKLIASKDIGGCEGRWCTAYQKTKGYWTDYVIARHITLIYLIGTDTKYAVAIYPDAHGMYEIFDSDDSHIDDIPDLNINKLNNKKMLKLYDEIQKKYFTEKSFVDKARTIDAETTVDNEYYVIWHDGIWKDGVWEDGEWENGVWKKGTWKAGTWNEGVWKDGQWISGMWYNGEWHDGNWLQGAWYDGDWYEGEWFGGEWFDGQWENGIWHKGIWRKGSWFNGIWKNGDWLEGIWYDGIWRDGTFKGGTWVDGRWEGGIFNGGLWQSGEWILGKWKGGYDKKGEFHDDGDSPDLWDNY